MVYQAQIKIPDTNIGDIFGELKILDIYRRQCSETNIKIMRYFKVECGVCGKIFDIRKYERGKTKKCKSCSSRIIPPINYKNRNISDIYGVIGKKWGCYKIIKQSYNNKRYLCECKCGNRKHILYRTVLNSIPPQYCFKCKPNLLNTKQTYAKRKYSRNMTFCI